MPIVLNPDDVPAFPDPPSGFDVKRSDVPHGKLEMISYESRTVGTTRKMQVYTPPGYSAGKKYPVLYLLHGIGGDETEWQRFARPDVLLDNLLAKGKITPMIVVMPNGRAQKNDRAEGNVFASAPAFAAFERDLLRDVIPTIEARYSVQADRGTGHWPACRWAGASRSTSGWHTSTPLPGWAPFPQRPTPNGQRNWSPIRQRQGEAEAALDRLRQEGQPDPDQPGRACLPEGQGRLPRLARGRQRA